MITAAFQGGNHTGIQNFVIGEWVIIIMLQFVVY